MGAGYGLPEYILRAHYKCWGCGHEWTERCKGPETQCPRCPSDYMTWLNHPNNVGKTFEETKGRGPAT